MSRPSAELERLGLAIERLALDPESISAPLTRLFRPVLHRIGWQPKLDTSVFQALVAQLEWIDAQAVDPQPAEPALSRAIGELAENLRQIERATIVLRRPMLAHAAWLRRLYEILVRAERAVSGGNRAALHAAASPDAAAMLPPLALAGAHPWDAATAAGQGASTEGDAARAAASDPAKASDPEAPDGTPRADPTRVLELQLDTIDHLMAAAREEDALLGRRRRLLDAARELLLESAAALALDEEGVQRRLEHIAAQITRINRQQAVGLRPDVALLHQARTALSRGDRDKLYAALSAMRRSAVDRGDDEVAALTTDSIERLVGGSSAAATTEGSVMRSAREMFGARTVAAIAEGYRRGRAYARKHDPEAARTHADRWVAKVVSEYYAPGRERDTLAHALTVDGCFDVGGVLSPVRIEEHFVRHRVVPYPTQEQRLVLAAGPEDLPTAVISDPRTIVLDLAAGRLLSRRYVREDIASRTRTAMQGEVRVYVLDGSTSMLGPRARMRDSILVAELATLLRRLENVQDHTRVVLYYGYFNAEMGTVTRVDTPGGAIEAIADVTGTPRSGGTDIEAALLASMRLVAKAQSEHSDLARAQIVLITDGNAPVDEARLSAARRSLGSLPVGVSVIALGEENAALRGIVARQRAASERAFYHFVPDDYLRRVLDGQVPSDGIHLPSVPSGDDVPLGEALGPLLEELGELQQSREAQARRELDQTDRDRRIERPDIEAAGEGDRARLEALHRDGIALQRRFDHWFPPPVEAPADPATAPAATTTAMVRATPEEGTLERDDLDSVLVVLATIAEVVQSVGRHRLGRQADAVDVLERLLPNARLTPGRYHEILRTYPAALGDALRSVHGSVESGLGWQLDHG